MPSRLMGNRRSLCARWLPGLGLGVTILLGAGFLIPAPASLGSEADPLARLLLPWWLLGVACMLAGWWLQALSSLPQQPALVMGPDADDLTIPLVSSAIQPAARRDSLDDLTVPIGGARHVR